MKDMTVVVMAKGGGAGKLFGSVTNAEIAEALEKQEKITLDKRKIVVEPHQDHRRLYCQVQARL